MSTTFLADLDISASMIGTSSSGSGRRDGKDSSVAKVAFEIRLSRTFTVLSHFSDPLLERQSVQVNSFPIRYCDLFIPGMPEFWLRGMLGYFNLRQDVLPSAKRQEIISFARQKALEAEKNGSNELKIVLQLKITAYRTIEIETMLKVRKLMRDNVGRTTASTSLLLQGLHKMKCNGEKISVDDESLPITTSLGRFDLH